MHYANGRPAQIGDMVRGKGYNIKYEITGMLVSAQPESTACNCQVATVTNASSVKVTFYRWSKSEAERLLLSGNDGQQITRSYEVTATVEYGQLDAFVAIDPETGEVLPPA